MSASVWLGVLKGGPFDGLPALSLRFEGEGDEIDLGASLEILTSLRPPPMHLHILYVEGAEDLLPLERFLAQASAYGMAVSVESFGGFLPWMHSKLIGWRTLHTDSDESISYPVEEIVFHTKKPPVFKPYPFHVIHPPVLWWTGQDLNLVPQGMRLWTVKRSPEVRLFPKEETL